MTLVGLVLSLVVIGVLLWLVNAYAAPWIQPSILKIINAVVVIAVIFWLLTLFGLFNALSVPVPRVR